MEHIYYLPTRATSLAHYFSQAVISPAAYYHNKPFDLQDHNFHHLLMCTLPAMPDSDCCIELALTDDEHSRLISAQGECRFYDGTLPITRIRRILFADKQRMDATLAAINISTAFLPRRLATVFPKETLAASNSFSIPTDIPLTHPQSPPLVLFDRFMGAVAMLRLSGEGICPLAYAATISFFNTVIRRNVETNAPNADFSLKGIFDGSDGFSKILPLLGKPIDESTVIDLGQRIGERVSINPVTRMIAINRINDRWLYVAAVLATYGTGAKSRRRRVDELMTSRFSTICEDLRPLVALCLGYHYGYSTFLKDYGKDCPFKFRLDRRLDYYVIESIFRYVFDNRRVSDTFPDFDRWWPTSDFTQPLKKDEFILMDQPVSSNRPKAVPSSQDLWDELCLNVVKDNWFTLSPQQQYRKITSAVYSRAEQTFAKERDAMRQEYDLRLKRCNDEIARLRKELERLKALLDSKSATSRYPLAPTLPPATAGDPQGGYSPLSAEAIKGLVEFYDHLRGLSDKDLKAKITDLGLPEKKGAKKTDRIIQLLSARMAEKRHDKPGNISLFNEDE